MYKLDSIVDEFLDEHDMPDNRRKRVYALAVSGLRELSMDISAIPKSVELDIDQNTDSVTLPTGFLDYISINVVGADGKLMGLGKNTRIDLTQRFTDCGVPSRYYRNTNATTLGFFTGYLGNPNYLGAHFRNGENIGGYYNAGGKNRIGEYRIDLNTNRILLSNVRGGNKIVLEYISDIQAENEDFIVHPKIINALKTWIDWKLGLSDQMTYIRAKKEAQQRLDSSTMQEWIDAIRSRASGVPKW